MPPDPATVTDPVPLWHNGEVTLLIIADKLLVVLLILNDVLTGQVPLLVAV